MKTQVMIAAAVIAAIAAAGFLHQSTLQADALGATKTAVVDVTRVLENSKKHQAWKDKMEKEQEQMRTEFNRLRSELEALEQNIRLRNRGSEDFIRLTGEYMEKRAILEAKNSFYEEKVNAQMQTWTEELYRTLLIVVDRVARQKGIDLVLATEQLDLPAPSLREFMLVIRTKKVLYAKSQLDITSEVLAALDSEN